MKKEEIVNILTHTDPFEMLPAEVLDELGSSLEVRVYPGGNFVFKQGDQSLDLLFIVASGSAEVLVADDSGQETVVGFRRAYDFFGETVVLSGQHYPASVRAKEELTCVVVRQRDLEGLIYAHKEFSGFFNTLLAERMRILYERIVSDRSGENGLLPEQSLFRQQVSAVMSSPVITCRASDRVSLAAARMIEENISSLLVLDEHGQHQGVLTARDLVNHFIVNRTGPIDDFPVGRVMNVNLKEVSPEIPAGQALVTMLRHKVKQLAVVERGKLVGSVSLVDLVKNQTTNLLLLTQEIENKQTLADLADISLKFDQLLDCLVTGQAGIREILAISSDHHERLTRKIIDLGEEEMIRKGWGAAPVDYCWINLGSAARREQTIRTDQDNALIYQDPPLESREEVEGYFKALAELVVNGLAQCGFAKCPGQVMATNPEWRRSLGSWTAALESWVESFKPDDVRVLTVLLDFRPVSGNFSLAGRFREKIFGQFKNSQNTNHLLARDDRRFKVPINFLGSLVTEKHGPYKNRLNLKTGALVHLVNGMRLLAVNHQIEEPGTLGRLARLTEAGVFSTEDADFFRTIFETLMMFKIRTNLNRIRTGQDPDDHIDPAALRSGERLLLKDALSGVIQFQKRIESAFSVPWVDFFR